MHDVSQCRVEYSTGVRDQTLYDCIILPQALLINEHGQAQVVDGPQRVWVYKKSFQRLTRVSADQKQYIKMQRRDGTIEHLPG